MGDNSRHMSMTGITTRFGPKYSTMPGLVLRVSIPILGLLALILGCIGSPNDLGSVNIPGNTEPSNYYGYGLGYFYDPLNIVYITFVILSLLISIMGPISAAFLTPKAPILNRLVYVPIVLLLLMGIICGGVGAYNFWRGCCNVVPPNPNPTEKTGLQYVQSDYFTNRPNNWCQCLYVVYQGDGPVHQEAFRFNEAHFSQDIHSALPHHFVIHGVSMGIAFVTAVVAAWAICVV